MLEKAIRYVKESLIKPEDRVVEFSDQDGVDRILLIDDHGQAKEIKPSYDFLAREALGINTLTGFVDYI